MGSTFFLSAFILAALAGVYLLRRVQVRLQLSKAKHPSLLGHSKMARRLARLVPFYEYTDSEFFRCDGASSDVVGRRREAFHRLVALFRERAPNSRAVTASIESSVSDAQFVNAYRVPFQFRNYVRQHLKLGMVAEESAGPRIKDMDGNWSYDLAGSYGVNVFGYDFYKSCMEEGFRRAQSLGPVLGTYHPLVAENIERIKSISGQDEVSFHMSGTEAVMQAVGLARYHTGRSHLVRFCGAYHGWWDGVQPGVGTHRKVHDVYTLKDMDTDTLKVLRTRRDIACVLVSPFQALHPNANAPGDAALIASTRSCHFDSERYGQWLKELRAVCSERGIVLIFDEVFSGFRLAYGGAQEYFNVRADMVTYGKTLGGGLPVGVLCGRHDLMKRYRDDRPTDISFARGTFNSHPYVMACMNVFLERIQKPAIREGYPAMRRVWDERAQRLNEALASRGLPVRVVNLVSIWSVLYTVPSRYNWMFQFYLRAEGLLLAWTGTGRLIFSHNYSEDDFQAVMTRFLSAAERMQADDWWWQGQGLTNKTIKKRVLMEMLAHRIGWGRKTNQAATQVAGKDQDAPASG
jgi:glutamate-1-semialdehyde 2,1-aminomutase